MIRKDEIAEFNRKREQKFEEDLTKDILIYVPNISAMDLQYILVAANLHRTTVENELLGFILDQWEK